MNHGTDTTHPAGPSWGQVFIHFDDYAAAERTAAIHIGPHMASAEMAGEISSWFFIRKNPCWRVRFLPENKNVETATRSVHHRLDTLKAAGHIEHWVDAIYEPETYAFGGPTAMKLAHHLFHADSRHILGYLGRERANSGRSDQRRELSLLLCSILMRGAVQDWYEQGDIWARVAEIRPDPPATPPDRQDSLESSVRRLITVDAGPASTLLHQHGPLSFVSEWATAFADAGHALGNLAYTGTLSRGVRAILAHHVIFHWNRLGLPYATQCLLAHTAKAVILSQDERGTIPTPSREALK
jgi:thiopeptide-type bacteriocin biosynthesis protein